MTRLVFLLVIGNLLTGGVAQAATYYTAKNGNDSYSCAQAQSVSSAKLTVNGAVQCLQAGDTLRVKAGSYDESLVNAVPSGTSWTNKVTIAAYPGETVWLRPTFSPEYVILMSRAAQYIEFDGINLDGGGSQYGAVKIEAWSGGNPHHIRMQNAEVKANANVPTQGIIADAQMAGVIGGNEFINLVVHQVGGDDFSHGFYIKSGNNLIENCTVYDFPGGGIHLYNSSYAMNGNIVRNNTVHSGRSTASGQRHWGIIIANGSSATQVYGNVIYGIPNQGSSSVGLYDFGGSGTQFYNNTVYAGAGEGIAVEIYATGSIVKNNLSYLNQGVNYRDGGAGTSQSNNLFGVNPQFVNPGAGDFQLKAGSPAIDAGATISLVTADSKGTARPQGAGYDVGALEKGGTATITPPSPPSNLRIVAN